MLDKAFVERFETDCLSRADTCGVLQHEAFFDVASELLIESGELSEANYARHTALGVQIDGYGGSLNDEANTLNVILIDYVTWDQAGASLTTTDVKALGNRAARFVQRCVEGRYRDDLDYSSPVYLFAQRIEREWAEIAKVRVIIISNRSLSTRFSSPGIPLGRQLETEIELRIWDLDRIGEVWNQGLEREPILVDFREMGETIYALKADGAASRYDSYVTVLPGKTLAQLYESYGTQLLEQNVRVYLQARGSVNKGIQKTILDEPEMFFAYNNGLTATAEQVDVTPTEFGLRIDRLYNLQIVNGGQTMASIYRMSDYCRKLWSRGISPDLASVRVQMKVSIVPPESTIDVVPKISRYANSQNKVSDADFFSNHPFHVEFERLAERFSVNPKAGEIQRTRWFYERMRGQYQNKRSLLNGRPLKEFDGAHPRSQVLTKTDLAKFLMPWEYKPEDAQKGAAKCFRAFAELIEKRWESNQAFCNEQFFKESVAKAILFRSTERIVSRQPWYEGGGNRAPIVIHTLGKLAWDLKEMGKAFPFQALWNTQELTTIQTLELVELTTAVKEEILNPPREGQLPTEWGKQQVCTKKIREMQFAYSKRFLDSLVSIEEARSEQVAANKEQDLSNVISAEILVFSSGAGFWSDVLDWSVARGQLTQREKSLFATIIQKLESGKPPTNFQSKEVYKVYERLRREGLPLEAGQRER